MNITPIGIRINTETKCPHGLPAGACPSCTGGGGGGGSVKKGDMSWDECYSIGLALNAAKKNAELNRQSQNQELLSQMMANKLSQKLNPIQNFIQARIILPVTNFLNKIAENPVLKPLVTIASNLITQFNNIKEKLKQLMDNFPNIMDKLVAIFGEQEKNLKEFISQNLNKVKKKIFGLLEMIDGSMEQGEHEKVEDEDLEQPGEEMDNEYKI